MDLKINPLDTANMKQPLRDNFGFGNKFSNRMFTQKYTPEARLARRPDRAVCAVYNWTRQRPFSITPRKYSRG
jgi:hypothetical protein